MLQSLFASVTKSASGQGHRHGHRHGRHHRDEEYVFPGVHRDTDGPNCHHDCADCTVRYPWNFKINTERQIYGSVKPFGTHVLVATGKTDWIPKVEKERGSLMEAFKQGDVRGRKGRIMVSASNISPQQEDSSNSDDETTVLVLPAFLYVDHMTVEDIPAFVKHYIDRPDDDGDQSDFPQQAKDQPSSSQPSPEGRHLVSRPCTRDYLVLLCSHTTRDRRCGISAPLIKQELERQLRRQSPHLLRDDEDSRPGGVGILFVSHVGGHKFAANVLVYRREAEQMIWLARVRPEHCEGIVRYTIPEGKVVRPEERLRGGADWARGEMSW